MTPDARGLLSYGPNWFDFIRCGGALLMLKLWSTAVRTDSPESGKLVLGTIIAVTLISMLIQALLVNTRRTFFVALPLVIAVAIFVPGWDLGIFAVLVTWAFCAAAKKFDLILPILAGILFVGGFILGTSRLDLITACGIVAFPQFFSIMFTRRIIFPTNITAEQ